MIIMDIKRFKKCRLCDFLLRNSSNTPLLTLETNNYIKYNYDRQFSSLLFCFFVHSVPLIKPLNWILLDNAVGRLPLWSLYHYRLALIHKTSRLANCLFSCIQYFSLIWYVIVVILSNNCTFYNFIAYLVALLGLTMFTIKDFCEIRYFKFWKLCLSKML